MGRGDGSNSGLGQRLKQARVEAGLTQKESGQAIGVDPNTIYSYETDRVNPSGPAIRALALTYGRPYAWFFGVEPGDESDLHDVDRLAMRLREARLQSGLSVESVANALATSRTTIQRYEAGLRDPSWSTLDELATVYNKPVEWFFGKEEKPQVHAEHLDAEAPDSPATSGSPSGILSLDQVSQDLVARFDKLESYIRAQAPVQAIAESRTDYSPSNYEPSDRSPVRLVEVASAAGVGAEVYDETPIGLLWFRNDWLLSHSIDPEQSNIISVRGESMEPTLPDGCSILVDRSQGRRRRRVGRIFVMRTMDGLVVKRAGKDAEGNWQIESEHSAWPPVPWSDTTEIIGEVRWAARTF